MTADISLLPNPYDFANPVQHRNAFAGREKELEDLRYYIEQARQAPRAINVALVGGRASGKTSLLNIVGEMARERGLLVARVDLDEGDTRDAFGFFMKLFDSIANAAFRSGAFGGLSGRTYDVYLDICHTLIVPEDKTFVPFQFPIQYAKVLAAGTQDKVAVLDSNLRHDLEVLSDEVKKPIVVLIDEGNVLQGNKVILEKLRNLLMNTRGYMLVLAGTEQLFPVLEDVFSPIIRQFRRIDVNPFESLKDTKACITRPLESSGIAWEQLFDRFRGLQYTTFEVHRLSGGRPYEIQLICHSMFRRVQSRRAKTMALDAAVLRDVRRQLSEQRGRKRESIIAELDGLERKGLQALAVFCEAGSGGALDTISRGEYLLRGEVRVKRGALEEWAKEFKERGLLEEQDGSWSFRGDDAERMYAKYLAKEKGVPLSCAMWPAGPGVLIRVLARGRRTRGLVEVVGSIRDSGWSNEEGEGGSELLRRMSDVEGKDDLFSTDEEAMMDLYETVLEFGGSQKVERIDVTVSFEERKASASYWVREGCGDDREKYIRWLNAVRQRAGEIGEYAEWSVGTADVPTTGWFLELAARSANSRAREILAHVHLRRMVEAYVEAKDGKAAHREAEVVLGLNVQLAPEDANNLGYLLLVERRLDDAERVLRHAASGPKEGGGSPLGLYNLGVVLALKGSWKEADAWMGRAEEESERAGAKENEAACVLELCEKDCGVSVVERWMVGDLRQVIVRSRGVLEQMATGSG